jgi:hypothetical protein
MRGFVLCLAAASAAVACAAPASAQYYGGYGSPYGFSHGGDQYAQSIYGIQVRLRNVIDSTNSAPYGVREQLRREAFDLDRRVRYAAQRGIDPWAVIGNRLERLEIAVQRAANRGYGYDRNYGGYHQGDRDYDNGRWHRGSDGDNADD